jgi:outer membrane protein assembly factor BamD (BamD/ComL family)
LIVVDTQHGSRVPHRRAARPGKAGRSRLACVFALPLSLCLCASGCAWDFWNLNKPEAPPGPADSLVLRGDKLEEAKPAPDSKVAAELAGAEELYRRGEYSKARKLFAGIADNTKNTPAVAEEARYYQAECLRQEGYYPDAADYFVKLLNDFPSGSFREQSLQHLFDIANFWLDDTRQEMRQVKERREGKRWMVDQHFFNWDRSKPVLDEEGHAIEKLEQVRYNDISGPLADKALFLMGSVKFFNEDYRDADHYFSQLVEMHPNSPFAAQAVELAIISKHMSTGGSDYDGRKVAEARRLVHAAFDNYPELANTKHEFLEHQIVGISLQQAEKDFKIAEFYKRTGHPESAYFYYEIVRRRYPGTKYADQATERMHDLRTDAEKSEGKAVPPPPPPGSPGPAGPVAPGQPLTSPETGPMPRPATPGGEVGPAPRKLPDPLQ